VTSTGPDDCQLATPSLRVCGYSRGYGLGEKNNNFMMAVGFAQLPMKRLPDAAALL